MVKKVENVEKTECCSCNTCKCGGCCCGKILVVALALLGTIAAIVAGIYSHKLYQLSVLQAGGEENINKMNQLYKSEAYKNYAKEQTDGSISRFNAEFGITDTDTNNEDAAYNNEDNGYSSLTSLKNIAVELGTNDADLQACIDEGRYVQAVNDMMNQAATLFGVEGTPGNIIVDRENGNYISIAGAYPVDEFVNAINEYKNGAENYVAGGDEVKNIVEDMLASTPIRGNKDARFTIVEYTELLCPYCQRHSVEGTINSVIEQFPDEVNSVSRHFIIHGDEALQLASAMECIAELNPDAYHKTFEEAFATGL